MIPEKLELMRGIRNKIEPPVWSRWVPELKHADEKSCVPLKLLVPQVEGGAPDTKSFLLEVRHINSRVIGVPMQSTLHNVLCYQTPSDESLQLLAWFTDNLAYGT